VKSYNAVLLYCTSSTVNTPSYPLEPSHIEHQHSASFRMQLRSCGSESIASITSTQRGNLFPYFLDTAP
jgi:hypothetical protein